MDLRSRVQAERIIDALKGISGSGHSFGVMVGLLDKAISAMEPGDTSFTPASPSNRTQPAISITAPIAYDLWYLYNGVNLAHHIDPLTDAKEYLDNNLDFLADKLNGIKPLKSISYGGLKAYGGSDIWNIEPVWKNEGAYFIQVMTYEICKKGTSFQFDSTTRLDKDLFVGHLTFPVGQLGVMEVISYFKQTTLEGESFELLPDETPVTIENPVMFPPMAESNPFKNYCFGEKLVESGYILSEANKGRFEFSADCEITQEDYTVDIKPKVWARLWIKQEDKFPTPGEFIGILTKPLSVPPHVWWFQESTPFVYAGNWVETENLTSGVITEKTLEASRTDGGIGNEYKVKINGTEITAYSSDFKEYEIDDRVAVLKRWSTAASSSKSFTWKDQRDQQHPVKDQKSYEFVIIPITFYKD